MKPINYLLLFIFITAQTFAQTEADKAKILEATNVAELIVWLRFMIPFLKHKSKLLGIWRPLKIGKQNTPQPVEAL